MERWKHRCNDSFFFIIGRYFRLQCKFSHCAPCEINYPKCENKEDGLWPQHEREITPFYMICENNRLIYQGYCRQDSLWGIETYPYNGQCVIVLLFRNNSTGTSRHANQKRMETTSFKIQLQFVMHTINLTTGLPLFFYAQTVLCLIP